MQTSPSRALGPDVECGTGWLPDASASPSPSGRSWPRRGGRDLRGHLPARYGAQEVQASDPGQGRRRPNGSSGPWRPARRRSGGRPHRGRDAGLACQVVLENGRFAGFLCRPWTPATLLELHRVPTRRTGAQRPGRPSDTRASPGGTWFTRRRTWRRLTQELHHALTSPPRSSATSTSATSWSSRRPGCTLIDCDSMQLTGPGAEPFFCRMGRPEFTPPELINADWTKTFRHPVERPASALAIHLYQLMMEGETRFGGEWSDRWREATGFATSPAGHLAHQARPARGPPGCPRLRKLLPAAIQAMFPHGVRGRRDQPRPAAERAGLAPRPQRLGRRRPAVRGQALPLQPGAPARLSCGASVARRR